MRTVLAVVAALGLVAAAYAVGASRGEDEPLRRVIVGGSTDRDPVVDKWVTAECPDGYTVISGGASVPHANDTPGVSLYWSGPYQENGGVNGWWAAAQDTARKSEPWLLQVQAICVSGVEDAGSNALPPETFQVPGAQ